MLTAILALLGVAVFMIASAYLAVRYGYRKSPEQIKTLDQHLEHGRPGWRIWM